MQKGKESENVLSYVTVVPEAPGSVYVIFVNPPTKIVKKAASENGSSFYTFLSFCSISRIAKYTVSAFFSCFTSIPVLS